MHTKPVSLLLLGMTAVPGVLPAVPTTGSTITVTSTGDAVDNDNACTLREAIIAAKMNMASSDTLNKCVAGTVSPAVDTIAFNIPDTDPGCSGGPPKICTITLSALLGALPDITEPVFINGFTQPNAKANTLATGDDAVILIRVDLSNVTGTGLHLTTGSDNSTLSGLSIVKPGGDTNNLGYLVKIDSNNVTVAGNFIGVEPDGHTVSTDKLIFYSLELSSGAGGMIGGTAPAARNLIAYAGGGGGGVALNIEGNSTPNLVQGNYVDLDATGTVGIGNAGSGIIALGGGNTIGGSAAGAGNVVGTWSGSAGMQFSLSVFHPGLDIAQGNRIGTNAAGTAALASGAYGFVVVGSGGTYKIGGSGAGEGNLIRGAQNGIYVHGDTAGGSPVIQGNHIGISLDGTKPLPCGTSGIVMDNTTGGLIGGTLPGEGNVIADNGTNAVIDASATGWAILGNSIHGNGFGISLAGSDSVSPPTQNDLDDGDTGPNNRQNYPVLGPGVVGPKTTVHISGSLNSEANKTYRLEFFANAGCDKSGHGQGKVFVGTTNVTTNPNDVAFGPLALTTPADRHVITATATDPDGNTSEFSNCSGDDTIFTDGLEAD